MSTLTINTVTRIEGHAHITLEVDDAGKVRDAQFHVTQFRGFEKFCEGRPFPEMPNITQRTCGICPISHLVASSKACDDLMAVQIPPVAAKLRRMINLAQILQSHALSFFHLSAPDLLLGWDSDPAKRNVFGLMEEHPQVARDGIRLRQVGQQIIELLGGKRIHPAAWVMPGGVKEPLGEDRRQTILKDLPEALEIAQRTYRLYRGLVKGMAEEARSFGEFPSLFMSLVDNKGGLEHYDGVLRIVDAKGNVIEDGVPSQDYFELIAEATERFSFVKSPHYRPMGYPHGLLRVGPLARLNVVDHAGTPIADEALEEFRALREDGPVWSSFHYHYARLIEILFCIEKIQALLNDPEILDERVHARARANRNSGIGVSEAPRGTLVHQYEIDNEDRIRKVNLVIATGHNNLAMNRSILQVAQHFVDGNDVQEGMLNRVEGVIRAYDPCLSCASHANGQVPLLVQVVDSRGEILREIERH